MKQKYLSVLTKEFLIEEYLTKRKPMCKIAKELNISEGIIKRYLVKYNIKTRSVGEAIKGRIPWNKGYGDYIKGDKNPAFKNVKATDKKWLQKQYTEKRLSMREIAKLSECSLRTVARRLKDYGIVTRSVKEGKLIRFKKQIKKVNPKSICPDCGGKKAITSKFCLKCSKKGSRNNNYKGLVNIKQLVRTYIQNTWRLEVFKRDRYICQSCKCVKFGELEAHHKKPFAILVDNIVATYNKALNTPKERLILYQQIIQNSQINDISNGITLCKKCHKKIHKGKRKDYYEISDRFYNYLGIITDVYDCDTVTANLFMGFGIMYETKLRLWGINGLEIRNKNKEEKKEAIKARNYVRRLILNKKLQIKTYKKEKYGRYLADIFLKDGSLLNTLLIAKGFAKEYWGGKR